MALDIEFWLFIILTFRYSGFESLLHVSGGLCNGCLTIMRAMVLYGAFPAESKAAERENTVGQVL